MMLEKEFNLDDTLNTNAFCLNENSLIMETLCRRLSYEDAKIANMYSSWKKF